MEPLEPYLVEELRQESLIEIGGCLHCAHGKIHARGVCKTCYNKAMRRGALDGLPRRIAKRTHVLSEINIEGRVATCSDCGDLAPIKVVNVRSRGRLEARCSSQWRQRQKTWYDQMVADAKAYRALRAEGEAVVSRFGSRDTNI